MIEQVVESLRQIPSEEQMVLAVVAGVIFVCVVVGLRGSGGGSDDSE